MQKHNFQVSPRVMIMYKISKWIATCVRQRLPLYLSKMLPLLRTAAAAAAAGAADANSSIFVTNERQRARTHTHTYTSETRQ